MGPAAIQHGTRLAGDRDWTVDDNGRLAVHAGLHDDPATGWR
jgi:hypothetical protein